jgi:hypothetical protein
MAVDLQGGIADPALGRVVSPFTAAARVIQFPARNGVRALPSEGGISDPALQGNGP